MEREGLKKEVEKNRLETDENATGEDI